MKFPFVKYHGTGNDFILIDDRKNLFPKKDFKSISRLCDRRFGVGADGVILLSNFPGMDFRMTYFNSDGKEGSLCGNGARCLTAFAHRLGIIESEAVFQASDGKHQSFITKAKYKDGVLGIRLKMNDVPAILRKGRTCFLNTGSPHFVSAVDSFEKLNVVEIGRKIRNRKQFSPHGTNVDFIHASKRGIQMRVYERGVEDETYSSGTGAVASALAAVELGLVKNSGVCIVETRGGTLTVFYKKGKNDYSDIWLDGPATPVFEGTCVLK